MNNVGLNAAGHHYHLLLLAQRSGLNLAVTLRSLALSFACIVLCLHVCNQHVVSKLRVISRSFKCCCAASTCFLWRVKNPVQPAASALRMLATLRCLRQWRVQVRHTHCRNSLLLRRTDLQRLVHTCTHLCLCNIFAKRSPSVCKRLSLAAFSWQALSNLGSHCNPAYKLSLHNVIAHVPFILSLQCISTSHTQDHGQSQAMSTVLPHVPFAI